MADRIPKSFIDDLLARVDIVDVIEGYVPLRKAGRDWQALCPFHHEKSPSFTVSQQKQFYYCFGCGASGSAIGFLMDYAHLDFPDAVTELAARAGMRVPAAIEGAQARGPDLTPLYDQLAAAQRYFARQLRDHPTAERAIDYLKRRGLTGEIAQSFGIGYAPAGWDHLLRALGVDAAAVKILTDAGLLIPREGGHYDRFRDRIMFPIHDHRGRVVGFGGRVLGDEEPKYLNSPETPVFHKGRELYGLYRARRECRELRRLLVVEGYMDVVALAQHGVNNAVATLGTATTKDHLERLFRVVSEVVFCFDGDAAGQRAAWRALEVALPLLRDGRTVGFLFMPTGEDPDSLVRRDGPEVFSDDAAVQPLSGFLFDTLLARVKIDTLDGRARLVDAAKPLLNQVPPGALQALLVQRLAELSRLGEDAVAQVVGTTRADYRRRPAPPARPRQAPSLVRTAVTLLMHQPALAADVADPAALRGAGLAGLPLLVDLIEYVQANPGITGGALLEHWRGTEHAGPLSKLLGQELPIPEDGARREFEDAVGRLRAMTGKSSLDQLLTRASPSQYSEAEKDAIRASIRSRKDSGSPS